MFDLIYEIIMQSSDYHGSNLWVGTVPGVCNVYYSHPHFKQQVSRRYADIDIATLKNKIVRAVKQFQRTGLMNPTYQRQHLVYFTKSYFSFIVAINPAGPLRTVNPNEKINPELPNVIFITALPMKTKEPYSKQGDGKVIINECKKYFNVIQVDI